MKSANRKNPRSGLEPCRKCGDRVTFEVPTKKAKGKRYYFLAYLLCRGCGEMYMLPDLRVGLDGAPTLTQLSILSRNGYRCTRLENGRYKAEPK